jgi:hypothetical protein
MFTTGLFNQNNMHFSTLIFIINTPRTSWTGECLKIIRVRMAVPVRKGAGSLKYPPYKNGKQNRCLCW